MRRELQARGEALERARAELQGADRRAEEGAVRPRNSLRYVFVSFSSSFICAYYISVHM